jgi:hypothetical protein
VSSKDLEKALFEAFCAAGEKLGPRVKGMSCFLKNWRGHVAAAEQKQAA